MDQLRERNRRRAARWAGAAWIAAGLFAAPSAAQDTETVPAPSYVEGIDLTLPAQEAFEGWPPDALATRSYWLPWTDASFRRASLFGRPVALVMTVNWSKGSAEWIRDVLTDSEVARALNGGYVTVVVNADLRPDLRDRYGVGAWPLVALLTPSGYPLVSQVQDYPDGSQPIWTTAPDRARMLFLLREGAVYWTRRSAELMRVGPQWAADSEPEQAVAGAATRETARTIVTWLLGNVDVEDGGFGLAPKFVPPSLADLAAARAERGDPRLRDHARFTLEKLVAGPLFDARDGGVYRLATEPSYGGLQREKLLENNVELLRQLVLSLRSSPSDALRDGLDATLAFLTGRLAREEGGFYHAVAAPGSSDGPPPVDRLVLSGPNAAAGAALLRAGWWIDSADLRALGWATIELVLREGLESGAGVRHAIEPEGPTLTYLDSLAEVTLALVDAFESTGDARLLEAARVLADGALSELSDPTAAGLRDRVPQRRAVGLLSVVRRPLRGNVRLARALLRLEKLGAGEEYRDRGLALLSGYAGDPTRFGVRATELALAIEEARSNPVRVEIAGRPDDPATEALRGAALRSPTTFLVVATGAREGSPVAEIEGPGGSRTVTRPEAMDEALAAVSEAP